MVRSGHEGEHECQVVRPCTRSASHNRFAPAVRSRLACASTRRDDPEGRQLTHRIRLATQQDAPDLAKVQTASWRAAFRGLLSDEFLDALDHEALTRTWEGSLTRFEGPLAGTLISEQANRVVGYSLYYPSDDEDDDSARVGMIGSLYTLPDVWGTGVGKALITASLDAMTSAGYAEATLWVLESNTRARSFYGRNGWHHDGAVVVDRSDVPPFRKLRYRKDLSG